MAFVETKRGSHRLRTEWPGGHEYGRREDRAGIGERRQSLSGG